MKKLLPYLKILIICIILLTIVGSASGFFLTKPQLQENSIRWSAFLSEGDPAKIADTRDYDSYYFLLGTYGSQRAYLASYKKLPVVPVYTRYIIATIEDSSQTGIGFKVQGKHKELLIAPPYTDILSQNEAGALVPAPETMD